MVYYILEFDGEPYRSRDMNNIFINSGVHIIILYFTTTPTMCSMYTKYICLLIEVSVFCPLIF